MIDRIIKYGSYVFCHNDLNYIRLDDNWISCTDLHDMKSTAKIVPIETIRKIIKSMTKSVTKSHKKVIR